MGLAEVSTILWRERELLELLLFKLEQEQLLLAAGRTRWLARATREVEVVLAEIRRTELGRAVEVDDTAAAVGLGPGPSLTLLASACPEPWSGLLRDHQAAFRTLTAEITQLSELNRDLLTAAQQAVLADISTHLASGGNTALLSADLADLDKAMSTITTKQAQVGANYNRVERMQQAADDRVITLKSSLSGIADIGLSKTIVELQMQQVAYQAALGATHKIITTSLADFLN